MANAATLVSSIFKRLLSFLKLDAMLADQLAPEFMWQAKACLCPTLVAILARLAGFKPRDDCLHMAARVDLRT